MSANIWAYPLADAVRPTLIESWPRALQALAMPARGFRLSAEEAAVLDRSAPLFHARLRDTDAPELHQIAARLAPLLAAEPAGGFVRLGSGSPKDSPLFAHSRGRCHHPVAAIKLLQTSRRLRAHLRDGLAAGYLPHVYVRPWMKFDAWQEVRCFMRSRQYAGLCQLDCVNHGALPQLTQMAGFVEQAARSLLQRVAHASHIDSAVLDLLVHPDPVAPAGWRATLVEINPWGPLTDPVLFDWRRPLDFDGSFRYLR